MKKVYPVILTQVSDGYVVKVPDLDIDTQGKDIADAIYMARDAIGLWGITEEDEGRSIPEPAIPIKDIHHNEDEIVTLIDIDFVEYRKMEDNQAVRQNCSLPAWLKNKADRANINFSKVLQDGLMKELEIQGR